MPLLPVIQLAKPLKTVKIVSDCSDNVMFSSACESSSIVSKKQTDVDAAASLQELETQKHLYREARTVLENVTAKLDQLCEDIIAGHHDAIARLSVEIARKVIMQTIEAGDYQIESIIREALKNAPKNTGIVVRLHPQDLAAFQKLQDTGQTTLSGFNLEADAQIGRAECVVESSKGIIKVLIDEHLEQISKALTKAG